VRSARRVDGITFLRIRLPGSITIGIESACDGNLGRDAMAVKVVGFLIASFSLGIVAYQLELDALITRQFRADVSREQHPVEFWITISVEVIIGLIGAMLFFFGPVGRLLGRG
jgi:hypothetical protein